MGFVGTDSLAKTYEKMVSSRNVNGHEFVVKRLPAADGAQNCQMVYASDAQAAAVISATAGKPISTIGKGENFSAAGGMIRLFKDGPNIRFDLDLTNAKTVRLKFYARLCQLARNIKGR